MRAEGVWGLRNPGVPREMTGLQWQALCMMSCWNFKRLVSMCVYVYMCARAHARACVRITGAVTCTSLAWFHAPSYVFTCATPGRWKPVGVSTALTGQDLLNLTMHHLNELSLSTRHPPRQDAGTSHNHPPAAIPPKTSTCPLAAAFAAFEVSSPIVPLYQHTT